jgi:hypothetical protein
MSALAARLSVTTATLSKVDGFMVSPSDSWRCGEASLHARRFTRVTRVLCCWIAAKGTYAAERSQVNNETS